MKIVITGPVGCGKSSYLKLLDERALNIEAKGRDNTFYTVGMDMGTLILNGFDIFLFGTPGLLRFSIMRDVIINGADGIIFMFDSAQPEKDKDAISLFNSLRKLIDPSTPIVILANKQDIEGARSPEVIKTQNNLRENYKIFPSSVVSGLNVKESIKYLVNEIFDNYKETLQLIRGFENNIRGLAEKINKDKIQMRDFLNSLELKHFIEIDRINKSYKVREGMENLI